MTPALSDWVGEKFNAPTIPLRGQSFHPWSCGRSGRSQRREVQADGVGGTVPRAEARGSTGSSPPRPEHAPRTDPRPRRGYGYGRGGSRGSVRGGGRGGPQATAPDPITPERGMCLPRNGQPAT
eukprot:6209389-Pleurochrysis_carterae.AAC.2